MLSVSFNDNVEKWQCWVITMLSNEEIIMLNNDDVNDESDIWNYVVVMSYWWCAICGN